MARGVGVGGRARARTRRVVRGGKGVFWTQRSCGMKTVRWCWGYSGGHQVFGGYRCRDQLRTGTESTDARFGTLKARNRTPTKVLLYRRLAGWTHCTRTLGAPELFNCTKIREGEHLPPRYPNRYPRPHLFVGGRNRSLQILPHPFGNAPASTAAAAPRAAPEPAD